MGENLSKAWSNIRDAVYDYGAHLIEMAPNILVALLVFILFVISARIIWKLVNKRLVKYTGNEAVSYLVAAVVKFIVIAFGILTALGILHLDKTVTSILAGIGLVGLALSFAFQHFAHNLLSGVVIATNKDIKVGDLVEVEGVFGNVTKVGLRTLTIDNNEGQLISLPNSLATDHKFKNYSTLGERRIDVECHIAYGTDYDKAAKVTKQAVEELTILKSGRPVECYMLEMADFSLKYEVRVWIDFEAGQMVFLNAKSMVTNAIYKALLKEGIEIPFPVTTVKLEK